MYRKGESPNYAFEKSFLNLIDSNTFKMMKKQYLGDKYSFKMLDQSYKDQAIELLCHQFSYFGGNTLSKVLNVYPNEFFPRMKQVVDDAIKSKLAFIIVNDYNQICYIFVGKLETKIDNINFEKSIKLINPKRKVMAMALHELKKRDKWYQTEKERLNKDNNNGHIFLGLAVATRKDVLILNRNFFKFCVAFARCICVDMPFIEYYYSQTIHPATIHTVNDITTIFFNKLLFSDINIDDQIKYNQCSFDKTCVVSSKLNVYQYFYHLFETDEWFRKNFDKNSILGRLNKTDEISQAYVKFEQIRKFFNGEQVLDKFLKFLLTKKSKM